MTNGTKEDSKGLKRMLEHLREGDTVITYKNDRMFRSLRNRIDLIDVFNAKGIHFKSLCEPECETTSANGKFLIQIFASVAEFDRTLVSGDKNGSGQCEEEKKLLGRPKRVSNATKDKYHYAKYHYHNTNVPI